VGAALVYSRSHPAAASSWVPADDSEVLEILPTGSSAPRTRAIATLREQLRAHPDDRAVAVQLARLQIEESRARSDPRPLGHAQAALAPWWTRPDAPDEVILLRATIRQGQRDFDGARADLDRLLARSPGDEQAWLARASIDMVTGKYEQASVACDKLVERVARTVCGARLASLTGQARKGYADLAALEGESAWIESTRAEIAQRTGDDAAAKRHFEKALALEPTDGHVLGLYADLLLDLGREAEVVTLLSDKQDNDALLVRLALATRSEAHRRALRERFDASRARGDVMHRREQARFLLHLEGNHEKALELARAGWQVQKEPADARILLECGGKEPLELFKRYEEPRLVALMKRVAP
jgi:predicted Zn-dependent protease